MKSSYILGLFLITIIVSNAVKGQIPGYEIREANKNGKIALSDIVGNWYSTDSSHSKIRFVNNNNSFVSIDGIKHGVGDYCFTFYGDSISVNGMAINWPPYDCTLSLVSDNLLKIEFYQFFSKGAQKVFYKR
jgi:hypothetical protein